MQVKTVLLLSTIYNSILLGLYQGFINLVRSAVIRISEILSACADFLGYLHLLNSAGCPRSNHRKESQTIFHHVAAFRGHPVAGPPHFLKNTTYNAMPTASQQQHYEVVKVDGVRSLRQSLSIFEVICWGGPLSTRIPWFF